MFIKRALHTARNTALSLAQLLVPLVFTIIALIVVNTLPVFSGSPPITLNFAKFTDIIAPYSSGHRTCDESVSLAKHYAETVGQFSSITPNYINNISEYKDNPDLSQYFIDSGTHRSISKYNSQYLLGLDIQPNGLYLNATVYFSNQALHAVASSLNAFDNALFRYMTSSSEVSITTINHPLPPTVSDNVDNQLTVGLEPFVISYLTMFGMSFLASSFSLFLIKEKAVKSKHSQFVSGVHAFTFWLSTFAWDYINYIIPVTGIMIAFAAFSVEELVDDNRWAQVLLLYALYGWAVMPFTYLLSFAFTVPSSGLVWLTILNILTGILL